MNMSIYWLAVNIYFEARGESLEGKKAVAHVTLNRAAIKNKSIEYIVFQKSQFSWANKKGRNTKARFVTDLDTFSVCWKAANAAVEEHNKGNTFSGITNFYNPKKVKKPKWTKKMKFIKKIGNHKFYNDPNYA